MPELEQLFLPAEEANDLILELRELLQAVSERCLHRLAGFCLAGCPARKTCQNDDLLILPFQLTASLQAIHALKIYMGYAAARASQAYPASTFKGDDPHVD
jgi:hypothetical protein